MPIDASSRCPLEPDPALFDALTAACTDFVRTQVLTLGQQPVADLEQAEALRAAFREGIPEQGHAIETLLDRLRPAIGKSMNTAAPGYLAFVPGGGLYSAALADYVALAVNRYVGIGRTAPALAEIETTVIRWLADMIGYPAAARGILTSGGSLSNLVAVITARQDRAARDFSGGDFSGGDFSGGDFSGVDFSRGDFSRATIYFSAETHLSVAKAARLAGIPAGNLRRLPVDRRFRLSLPALHRAVAADRARGLMPLLLVVNAGTTSTGAVDPIPQAVAIARRHGLWVHADAAYGGFFRMIEGGEALVPGLDLCDSVTLDPHKGLFLPYGTGCLLVRDGAALYRTFKTSAGYLQDVTPDPAAPFDFADLSPELSREFRGLRLWLPLQLHGLAAFRTRLREKLDLARLASAALAAIPGIEIVAEPQLSIVAFRLRRADDAAGAGDGDAANAGLLRRINESGRVFLSSTRLDGRFTLRLCVLNFRTHEEHVREAVEWIRLAAARPSPPDAGEGQEFAVGGRSG